MGGLWGRKDEGLWADSSPFCGPSVCGVRGCTPCDGNQWVSIPKEMGISAAFVNEVVLCYTRYEHRRGKTDCVSTVNGMCFMINNMGSLLSFWSRKTDLPL